MDILQERRRLGRGIGLLLMLIVSIAGFMLLINLLADPVSTAPADPLAEQTAGGSSIRLPGNSSLFSIAVALVAIIIASVALISIVRPRLSRSASTAESDGSTPMFRRGRLVPIAIGSALALLIAGAGLYLAFAESSPLLQAGAGQQAGAAGGDADGHRMYRSMIAPAGVVILAAFFFSVILIGFLNPRLIFVALGTWLALSLIFGFFSSSSLAGLALFTPVTAVPVPDAFASQVAQYRTVDLTPNQGSTQDGDGSAPGSPDGTGSTALYDQTDQSADASEDLFIQDLESSPDPEVRAEAARALQGYTSERSLRALVLAGLEDPNPDVREAALDSISEWTFEELVALLKDHPESDIRQAAAAALGRMKDRRAVRPLGAALESDSAASVRAESAKALGRLGYYEAGPSLIEALEEDAAATVRESAARALGQLRELEATNPLIDTLAGDASADVRVAAAWALGQLRQPHALGQLLHSRDYDLSPRVRAAARAAIERYTLTDLIGRPPYLSTTVSSDVSRVLAERGESRAIPLLLQTLNDSYEGDRSASRDALEQLADITTLENGGMAAESDGTLYLGSGLSARQVSAPSQLPVFTVSGAANTTFLRAGIGQSYYGQGWSRRATSQQPYGGFYTLGDSAFFEGPFLHLDNAAHESLRIAPRPGTSHFGPGPLPVPYIMRSVTTSGTFDRDAVVVYGDKSIRGYEATATIPRYSDAQLYAAELGEYERIYITEDLPQRVVDLARDITANHQAPYAKAKAIEAYLKQNYEYAFADPDDAPIPDGQDLVDWFLFESREGTCGSFASAFAVLASSIGMPARVVTGWAITPSAESQIVYTDQAHMIAEVLFEGYGWVQFEPTPGGGPVDRSSESFERDRSEIGELARLRDVAAGVGYEGEGDALRELEEAGATIHTLENGSQLVTLGAFTLATPPGTTVDQADGLVKLPIFTVTGADDAGYLVTTTGDVYRGDGWEQLDPVAIAYGRDVSVPDLVRDSFEDGQERWSGLPQSRVEPILLAPDGNDFSNGSSVRIQVAPIDDSGWVPAGVIPVSRNLNRIGVDGSYYPYSGTFSMAEPTTGYEWWSVLPGPSESELNRAVPVADPTYTQLPDDLDGRIYDLAQQITAGHRTPYAKASALESYLRSNYAYVLGKDSTKPRRPAGFDGVEWFLFETQEGTCGQFSSAFTVLARSVGLPARVVSGWMISSNPGTQIVYSDQGHQWAEVAFEDIGWILFEATAPGGAPTRVDSTVPPGRPSGRGSPNQPDNPSGGPNTQGTVTDITSWPGTVERGKPFTVGGTVRTDRGALADDMEIEIFVNVIKANGGLRVGTGTVENGRYEIEVEIPPALERGRYQLIAHAIGNARYFGSWSDPDFAVISESGLVFSGPQEVDVGADALFQGRVTEDTGEGVSGIPLQILIDGIALPSQRTRRDGTFSFSTTFPQPGLHWAQVRFSDRDFLEGNSARIDLEAVLPTSLSLDVQPQALVDETFTVAGLLLDSRDRPLSGKPVGISVDGGAKSWETTGADGRFTLDIGFGSSGRINVEATFEEERPVLGSSASATVVILNESVLTFEGLTDVLAGDTAYFHGRVSSPTLDALSPVNIEILDADGAIITPLTTQEDGTFVYQSSPMTQTGPHSLTARLPEQGTLTASAASVLFSVVHETILQVDGPAIATLGGDVVMAGELRRADGQPIAEALVQVGTEAIRTDDDGTFSYSVPIPTSLGDGAIEQQVRIPYRFAGTEHLASAEGSRSIIVGVPRLIPEQIGPVARGDIAEIRGAAFTGTRPLSDSAVSLTADLRDTTGPTGEFRIEYAVPSDAPLGPRALTTSLDELGVTMPIMLDIRSATNVAATPLGDIRPGRTTMVQAALYDDSGAGIPNATLGTSTGLTLTTDASGVAQFEIDVPESENLLAVPITFTYSGNDDTMPLNYLLSLPITPASFNWLLFVGLPALLLFMAGAVFSVYRLRQAGVPGSVLDPRRPLPSLGAEVVTVQAPVLREPILDDEEQAPDPVRTRITIEQGGLAAATPGVYGISEEAVIIGRLHDDDGAPLTEMTVILTVGGREAVEMVTDWDGEFRHRLAVDAYGEFTLSAYFAGTPDYVESQSYTSFRVVDFREEMVRLFGEFVEWASRLNVDTAGQSPREIEASIVVAGIPVDQRALDEVVTRFEEADYSEHHITRRHYEAMYRAWRTVAGD